MCLVARLIITIAIAEATVTGSQLPVKIYTTADGLGSNRINKIVRDSRGYLWFCTNEGLSRFDGYGFTNYGPQQGLPPSSINDLLEMRGGEYWIATSRGLVRFDPTSAVHKFSVFVPDDKASRGIYTIADDHAGGLWCGTYHGLCRFERTAGDNSPTPAGWRFRRVEIGMPRGGSEPDDVTALLEDRRGALWIGAENGLYRLIANGVSDRFTTGNGLPSNKVRSLLEDRLERLWAGTNGGLCRITSDRAAGRRVVERIYTTADGLATNQVWSLLDSSDNKLWAGGFDGLSELLAQPLQKVKALNTYTMANGLSGTEIYTITEDRNHNLWVGSAEGAMKIPQSSFSPFAAADGLTPESNAVSPVKVSSIFQDQSGALCVTTQGRGRQPFLSGLEGKKFKSIFPNLPAQVADIGWGTQQIDLQDRTGDWWIATTKGLVRFALPAHFEQLAHAQVKAIYTTSDGLPTDEVFRIFEDSRGDIWVATVGHGLVRWDRRTESFQRDAGLVVPGFGEFVSAFAEDRAGDVWIGLFGGGVARFRNCKFAHYGESDLLGGGGVRDIYSDRAGRVWVATTRGVTRIDSPESDRPRFTNIGLSQGLSSAQAECITEDRWGRIYVGGGRGIDRFDPTAPNGGVLTKHFTTADGLAAGNLQAAFADREGNLWFGTTLGLSRLVPEADPSPSPPNILISGLRIRGVPYPLSDLGVDHLSGIRLRPDQTQIEVSFLGLSFAAGEVLRYQFMLADADPDWGPLTTERTVSYARLKPGSYRFLVRAVNSAGIAGPAPASVAFTILPPVWQRWWFLALCASAALSVLYALYRGRVGRLLQVERLRTSIAMDLHDDIGASLSQIAAVSEALSQRGGADDRYREPLSQIAMDSREMVSAMSDLVWAIDPRRDHLQDLVQRMRRFASEMLTACNIRFRFSAPASSLRLSVDQRRHIFLIFKESVNNAARHSGCSEAEAGLDLEADTLVLHVHDNGHGLDMQQTGRGNGLNDMRTRAKALGGEVVIGGGQDCGTTVTLRVPLGRLPGWQAFFHLNRW